MSGGLLMMTLVVLGGAIFMAVRLIGKVGLASAHASSARTH